VSTFSFGPFEGNPERHYGGEIFRKANFDVILRDSTYKALIYTKYFWKIFDLH